MNGTPNLVSAAGHRGFWRSSSVDWVRTGYGHGGPEDYNFYCIDFHSAWSEWKSTMFGTVGDHGPSWEGFWWSELEQVIPTSGHLDLCNLRVQEPDKVLPCLSLILFSLSPGSQAEMSPQYALFDNNNPPPHACFQSVKKTVQVKSTVYFCLKSPVDIICIEHL